MRALLLLIGVHCCLASWSQRMEPQNTESSITFNVRNLGLQVNGRFTGLDGQVVFAPADPASSFFDLSVDASTVDTGIDLRDSHLKKGEYFDVKRFPTIRFVSTKVAATATAGSFTAAGNLTIKGTTKEISFPFTAQLHGDGYAFKGTFTLNRGDFDIGGSSLTLADYVDVMFTVKALIAEQ